MAASVPEAAKLYAWQISRLTRWHDAITVRPMKTVKDVIEALGGAGPVSDAVGVTRQHRRLLGCPKAHPPRLLGPTDGLGAISGISAVSRDVLNAVCMPRRRRRAHGDVPATQPSEAA